MNAWTWSRWGGVLAAVAVATAVLTAAAPARAQGADAELRAAEQFDLGQARKEAGDLAGACQAFEESQRLAPAVATQLNLVQCRIAADRLLAAAELLRDAVIKATAKGDRIRAEKAQLELRSVVALTPLIAFDLPPGVRATAQIDGVEVEDPAVATMVDPGRHVVEIRIDGAVRVRKPVTLARSAIEHVRITPDPAAKTAPTAARVATPATGPREVPPIDLPTTADAPAPGNRNRNLVLGLGAGTLALAAVGTLLILHGHDLDDEATALCPGRTSVPCAYADPANRLIDDAVLYERIGIGTLVGAGVVGITAAVLWHTGRPPTTTRVDVAIGDSSACVLVRAAF